MWRLRSHEKVKTDDHFIVSSECFIFCECILMDSAAVIAHGYPLDACKS